MKTKRSARWLVRTRRIVIGLALVAMVGGAFWAGEYAARRVGPIASSQTDAPPVPNVNLGDLVAAAQ